MRFGPLKFKMSIECSTGSPLVRKERDSLQVELQNQPPAEHDHSSHRAEYRQQVMSFIDSEVVADVNKRTAAKAPVQLKTSTKIVGASGSVISEKGKANFALNLGRVESEVEAIVSDIEDGGVLGVDVLQNGKEGPTDLLLSKGVLVIENQEIPVIQVT